MPTRRITASPVKVTGTVPDGQKFESTLEEDFFLLLRFNRLVATFEHQPITIEWLDATGRVRRYTPDVLVHYRTDLNEADGMVPMLCEIKPDLNEEQKSPRRRTPLRIENEEENVLKWAAAERYASRHGWGFKVYRENEIRTPYLDNARFLLRHIEREYGSDSNVAARLLQHLRESGEFALGGWADTLATDIRQRAEILPACYRLIGEGKVEVNLSERLTLQSVVRPNNG